jgi:hypothetical protein
MQTFGPWPAWKFPKRDTTIPKDVRTLYIVDLDKSFMIMVLRTNIEDRPIVIGGKTIVCITQISEIYLDVPEDGIRSDVTIVNILEKAMHREHLPSISARIYGSFDNLTDQNQDIKILLTLPSYPTTIFAFSVERKPS